MPAGFEIKQYRFEKPFHEVNDDTRTIASHVMGLNWPVVYILHGNQQVYVGETSSVKKRMEEHANPLGKYYEKRKNIDTVEIIFDPTFNKSAILDIEQSLIGLFRFEIELTKEAKKKSKYFKVLQNGNGGQSKLHNYYRRAAYREEVQEIWNELKNRNLATNSYQDIANDILFKYSPYTTLNEEQKAICIDILNKLLDALENNKQFTALVNGAAGTGKTIVLLHMLTKFMDSFYSNETELDEDSIEDDDLSCLSAEAKIRDRVKHLFPDHPPRIAYVAQMTSLKKTIGSVLSNIPHLKVSSSKTPSELVKNYFQQNEKPFDVVFVDEAHRLCQYKSISWMGAFKNTCLKLYGDNADPNDYTTLDWIFKCSKTQVLIYDGVQTVKDSDITSYQFNRSISSRIQSSISKFELTQQMRCNAGIDYINYLSDIFDCKTISARKSFEGYDIKLYDNPNTLIDDVLILNRTFGLCKVTAGYGWQWNTNSYAECEKKYKKYIIENNIQDNRSNKVDFYCENLNESDGVIVFGDKKYVRNLDFNWILQGDPREIGCIHTSQGYDLNYVGVLFSPEITYRDGRIHIDLDRIKDGGISTNLTGLNVDEAKEKTLKIVNYVINSYKVMMERGIKGCYLYAYNKELQDYLAQFFDLVSTQKQVGQENTDNVDNVEIGSLSKDWRTRLAEQQREMGIVIDEDTDDDIKTINIENISDRTELHTRYIPLFGFKIACGGFESGESIVDMAGRAEEEGWIDCNDIGVRAEKGMFVVRAKGNSMLPRIKPGDLCLFKQYTGGSRHDEIVLARQSGKDSDYNSNFTIKKYYSEKTNYADGTWTHKKIELRPLNPEYPIINIDAEEDVDVFGIFVKVINFSSN